MASSAAILLVDNTCPPPPQPESQGGEAEIGLQATRTNSGPRSLAKKLTGLSVRENLARRKYAKWQKGRYSNGTDCLDGDDSGLSREDTAEDLASRSPSVAPSASTSGRLPDSGVAVDVDSSLREQPTLEEPQLQAKSEIDILYENQRGWFFFGKPIFSKNSLLNLDPPTWQTGTFEQSPVTIASAQVPDPSWEWDWRTWYVDMSYDVDEEGWQYSFSFASRFAWHGTHPWCHSFVRRRRWLRRRVRKALNHKPERRVVGVGSSITSAGGAGTVHSARYSRASLEDWDDRIAPEDITNVAVLSRALRVATLDRERIDAIKEFIHRGEDELVLLENKMPDVMSILLFQSSRRQLLKLLKQSIDEIPQDSTSEPAKSRRESLLKALRAGDRVLKEMLVGTGP